MLNANVKVKFSLALNFLSRDKKERKMFQHKDRKKEFYKTKNFMVQTGFDFVFWPTFTSFRFHVETILMETTSDAVNFSKERAIYTGCPGKKENIKTCL